MSRETDRSINASLPKFEEMNMINIEFYKSLLEDDMNFDDRRTIENLLYETVKALDGHRSLRELAIWYRHFAERATNAVIREARRRTAQALDVEADAIELRLSKRADPRTLRRPSALDGG